MKQLVHSIFFFLHSSFLGGYSTPVFQETDSVTSLSSLASWAVTFCVQGPTYVSRIFVFQTMMWLPMLRICDVHAYTSVCSCTWGLCEPVGEPVTLKVGWLRKIPCHSRELNLCQQCTRPDFQPPKLHPCPQMMCSVLVLPFSLEHSV